MTVLAPQEAPSSVETAIYTSSQQGGSDHCIIKRTPHTHNRH